LKCEINFSNKNTLDEETERNYLKLMRRLKSTD
jgi:hypothetical protein